MNFSAKFIITLSAMLLPLSSFAASHPWTDVPGCYKTLTHNGKPVNTNGAQSTIRDVEDLAVIRDIKGQPLGGLEIIVIQNYDVANDEMKIDYQAALTGKGNYRQTEEQPPTRIFEFEGFIKFQDMPPMLVKQNVSAKWTSSTQLLLKTKRVVVGTGGAYDTDDAYLLEKENCQ